jgi:N-carbamoyl-D-amino-acid hydrolase
MNRYLTLGVCQTGPVQRNASRAETVGRLIHLLETASRAGAELAVFPEMALTTFFPRWPIDDPREIDGFYETQMPGPQTQPLFDAARRLDVGFALGFAELDNDGPRQRRFNSMVLVDAHGNLAGRYRKMHIPGSEAAQAGVTTHLEQRYFEPGNLGFPVWRTQGGVFGMCICNDRRWPETYRVMGLQGVEVVLLGYNTPVGHTGFPDVDGLSNFHNHLSMQAGAYQNSTWVVGTAKCGIEEGSLMIGQSAIIAPSGEIVATALTLADEVITASCDLDFGKRYSETIFNFARHREPSNYGLIVERKGAVPPA